MYKSLIDAEIKAMMQKAEQNKSLSRQDVIDMAYLLYISENIDNIYHDTTIIPQERKSRVNMANPY
jgi:hypothetical protein